jgi:hypothetical protein
MILGNKYYYIIHAESAHIAGSAICADPAWYANY